MLLHRRQEMIEEQSGATERNRNRIAFGIELARYNDLIRRERMADFRLEVEFAARRCLGDQGIEVFKLSANIATTDETRELLILADDPPCMFVATHRIPFL